MNAIYWGLTALCIMKYKDALDAEETIEYVMSCWDDEAGTPRLLIFNSSLSVRGRTADARTVKGAFGAHPGHDAHILSTLSAIQILATHDALVRIDAPRVIDCTSRLLPSMVHPLLSSPPPPCSPSWKQSLRACNSPRASSPATHSARRTRASSTAPCLRCRSSAHSTGSIARAPYPTSPRVGTLTGALGASPAPRATRRKVRPLLPSPFTPPTLHASAPLASLLTPAFRRLIAGHSVRHARSMGVHGCACDPRSIGRDRRVDARMVACRETAAQWGPQRAPREARRCASVLAHTYIYALTPQHRFCPDGSRSATAIGCFLLWRS